MSEYLDPLQSFILSPGDPALRRLVEDHYKYLTGIVAKKVYRASALDPDDLRNLLYCAILMALPKFNPAKASFQDYLEKIVTRALNSALRAGYYTQKSRFRKSVVSLDDPITEGEQDSMLYLIPAHPNYDPANRYNDQQMVEEVTRLYEIYRRLPLSRVERRAAELVYLQGYKYDEATKILGVNHKAIDNALARVKRKARGVLVCSSARPE